MERLKGYQRKYLKGLAHELNPLVFVGQKGLSSSVIEAADEALEAHELIKMKFVEFKEKEQKEAMANQIEKETESEMVGMIGHIAIFYRPHKKPEKRSIVIPQR